MIPKHKKIVKIVMCVKKDSVFKKKNYVDFVVICVIKNTAKEKEDTILI